jgi:pyridoxine 5-phosphate synthase
VDPVVDQVEASKEVGADMIEIHTGEYANAQSGQRRKLLLRQIRSISKFAAGIGLGVNAGHGLDYENVKPVAGIQEIDEVSIGHAIMVRAVFVGLEEAVREMVKLVKRRE